MEIIREFARARRESLRLPAVRERVHELFDKYGERASELFQIYDVADGERGWGAVLPGLHLNSLQEISEMMEATKDSWEWLEDLQGVPHFMRDFIPLFTTSDKTCIGPVLGGSSILGCVIEYRFETGEIRILSRCVNEFLRGILGLSMTLCLPESVSDRIVRHKFSKADNDFLSEWPELTVTTPTAVNVADL